MLLILMSYIHSKVSSSPEPLGPESTGRRRMDDLREEIGVLFSLTGRIGRSQMTWCGWRKSSTKGSRCDETRKTATGLRGLRNEGCEKGGGEWQLEREVCR